MRARNEEQTVWRKFGRPIVFGAVIGAVCSVLLLLLMAVLMAAKDMPEGAVTPLALVAGAAGAIVGGFVGARIAGERGLLYGAACGLLLAVLLSIAGWIARGEMNAAMLPLKLGVMVACGAIGGVMGVNLRRR